MRPMMTLKLMKVGTFAIVTAAATNVIDVSNSVDWAL